MYLHLGADTTVFVKDLIGIFDIKLQGNPDFQELLSLAEWRKQIVVVEGKAKSVVVTRNQIYLVPVSRATLFRRWNRWRKEVTNV